MSFPTEMILWFSDPKDFEKKTKPKTKKTKQTKKHTTTTTECDGVHSIAHKN